MSFDILRVNGHPINLTRWTFSIYLVNYHYGIRHSFLNSLSATGDTGRQPPLLPPLRAAISVDTIIHHYRLSTPL